MILGKKTERLVMFSRVLTLLMGVIGLIMLPPLVMAIALREGPMIHGFIISLSLSLGAALPSLSYSLVAGNRKPVRLSPRDGFLLVFLTWVLASLLGALPFLFSGLSFTDAVFESAAGFTTTGGSTIADIEALPRSLLLWRSLTHWFGGMGIVLLTVALMPLLGVGGFQLIKAESPGPEKEKMTPKIAATAKFIWIVYSSLTLLLTLLYRLGGMGWFDAVCHGLSIMAGGGISTKNAGLAYYDSAFIDGISLVFMLLTAINYSLYYRLLRGKFRDLASNTELKAFLGIFLIAAVVLSAILAVHYGSLSLALRYGFHQAASILSTTGAVIIDYEVWPQAAKAILLVLAFIGGCSGSTAGGIKVIRYAVLFKQAGNELRQIIYPRGIFKVQINRKVGRKDLIYGAAGFFFLYFLVMMITTLITAASGTDLFSSFSAALSVIGNIGAGFGAVGFNGSYGGFPGYIKWLYSFVMIAGRLELWTVFILFMPAYWRK
jgi:trk system potassium uptake protein TrkH